MSSSANGLPTEHTLNLITPRVARVEIMPTNPVVEAIGSRQQVRVVATYTDGSTRDVTREAFLESGNTDVVTTVPDQPGLAGIAPPRRGAVLVRYEGNYAATTLTVMGDRSGFAWEDRRRTIASTSWWPPSCKRTKTLPSAAVRRRRIRPPRLSRSDRPAAHAGADPGVRRRSARLAGQARRADRRSSSAATTTSSIGPTSGPTCCR